MFNALQNWLLSEAPEGSKKINTSDDKTARNNKAARLSAALADPEVAAQALLTGGVRRPGLASQALASPAVQALFAERLRRLEVGQEAAPVVEHVGVGVQELQRMLQAIPSVVG